MSFKVTAPLVIISNVDGKSGDWYGYVDALVPTGLNDDRCEQLVKEGMMEKIKAPAPAADSETKSDKVADILAEVGEDKDKAAAALEAEQAKGEKARKTLVDPLEALLAKSD
jgi:hypothetical protein